MADLEKVIRGLEHVLGVNDDNFKDCLSCSYRKDIDHGEWACQVDEIMKDALSVLEANKPHLITQEEFFNHPDRSEQGCLPLWYEEKSGKQGWCFVYYLADNPGEEKRYWTSRPTNEQREAAPWEK